MKRPRTRIQLSVVFPFYNMTDDADGAGRHLKDAEKRALCGIVAKRHAIEIHIEPDYIYMWLTDDLKSVRRMHTVAECLAEANPEKRKRQRTEKGRRPQTCNEEAPNYAALPFPISVNRTHVTDARGNTIAHEDVKKVPKNTLTKAQMFFNSRIHNLLKLWPEFLTELEIIAPEGLGIMHRTDGKTSKLTPNRHITMYWVGGPRYRKMLDTVRPPLPHETEQLETEQLETEQPETKQQEPWW